MNICLRLSPIKNNNKNYWNNNSSLHVYININKNIENIINETAKKMQDTEEYVKSVSIKAKIFDFQENKDDNLLFTIDGKTFCKTGKCLPDICTLFSERFLSDKNEIYVSLDIYRDKKISIRYLDKKKYKNYFKTLQISYNEIFIINKRSLEPILVFPFRNNTTNQNTIGVFRDNYTIKKLFDLLERFEEMDLSQISWEGDKTRISVLNLDIFNKYNGILPDIRFPISNTCMETLNVWKDNPYRLEKSILLPQCFLPNRTSDLQEYFISADNETMNKNEDTFFVVKYLDNGIHLFLGYIEDSQIFQYSIDYKTIKKMYYAYRAIVAMLLDKE